jgi:hypothetical protein
MDNEIGECSMDGADEKCTQSFSYLPQAMRPVRDISIGGRKDNITINLTETKCYSLDFMLN